MSGDTHNGAIRVLVADDDADVLACYVEAFSGVDDRPGAAELDALSAELFPSRDASAGAPGFEVEACRQGEAAVAAAEDALRRGRPFHIVILDVRMPPGIDGIETGRRIRQLAPDVDIVFVSGYSDVGRDVIERRIPPPARLHVYSKPLSFERLAADVVSMVRLP